MERRPWHMDVVEGGACQGQPHSQLPPHTQLVCYTESGTIVKNKIWDRMDGRLMKSLLLADWVLTAVCSGSLGQASEVAMLP